MSPNLQTYTGNMVDPLDLEGSKLDIVDIAHALSNLCRFGGHTKAFYSVAEHSIAVSYEAEKAAKGAWAKRHAARAGLLHDASEAYLVDLPRPIKNCIPDYKAYENFAQAIIAKTFKIQWPFPQVVHDADDRMLVTEMRDLMPTVNSTGGEPYPDSIYPLSPKVAEALFLERFHEIF